MSNALKIAPPPARRTVAPAPMAEAVSSPAKFDQVKEDERVQFNHRVKAYVADGLKMMAIRTKRKVPDLLAEALELLEARHGKV